MDSQKLQSLQRDVDLLNSRLAELNSRFGAEIARLERRLESLESQATTRAPSRRVA